jgi:hypothetical protein
MNRLCPICKNEFSWFSNVIYEKDLIFYCKECSFYAKPEMSSPSYSDDYLLHYKLYERTILSARICQARWSFIEENVDLNNKTLVDFGCGSRVFTKYRMKRGFTKPDMFNYDPYFCKDHTFLDREIDIMTLWDSLEHVSRLEMIPLIGADDIFLCLPVTDGLNGVDSIFSWKHYVPNEHLWYFSTTALKKLFKRWGYSFVKFQSVEGHLRSSDILSFYFKR